MSIDLAPGLRLRSVAGITEVIVVRAPGSAVDLECGGHPMVALTDGETPAAAVEAAHAQGSQLGKRYADEDAGVEVLCTKAGEGSLSLGGRELPLKEAKPLPASD
ncbi:MAG: hypothetical protein ACRDXE_05990 [Acidimicrobiales bacterium]